MESVTASAVRVPEWILTLDSEAQVSLRGLHAPSLSSQEEAGEDHFFSFSKNFFSGNYLIHTAIISFWVGVCVWVCVGVCVCVCVCVF